MKPGAFSIEETGITNMNVLVTGGAGFIGSHLVDALLAVGTRVRVLDNLSTGKRANLPAEHERLEFVRGDIRESDVVQRAAAGVDAVVHLAAVASVQASVDDPRGTHETNLVGTLNVLEGARIHGVRRIVYASSAAIYGDEAALPVREDSRPNPLTPYAADKLSGEYYLGFYGRKFGIVGTAFRFFNIYGPRQDPSSPYSGVISIFVDRLRERRPVTLFGDGNQTRDFVYVGDLVDILVRSLTEAKFAGQTINVGRGVECSLLQLLSALERAVGATIERQHAPPRVGDIVRSCAAVDRLRAIAGMTPPTEIDRGLARLLQSVGLVRV